jgi:2,5-diketo-D-gluconate reductase A
MAMTRHLPSDAVPLPSGASIPLLGLGTWELDGAVATEAVSAALDLGYRHLDTATVYWNERAVGEGVRASGVPREDVFITTKCPPDSAGRELENLRESLDLLGTDHVDLWLIHWPSGERIVDMWRAFVEAQELGLARDIGVSNFDVQLLDEVTDATGVRPAVNQVEWSPRLFDPAVLEGHRSRGVVLEGYSALRGGTLDHPVITGIAERLGRTAAQVIVRWHLQHGVVVIPRSSRTERIHENADVDGFELSADDMAALDGLGADG